jgi:glycosyltransferase involved in cell wall biosynthesis
MYASRRIDKGNSLLFYNINERNFLPYIYFRFFRGLPCYVVLADYGHPSKSYWFRLFHHLLKKSDGILSLSPYIKINSNTQVQQLLVDSGEDIFGETPPGHLKSAAKNILFSGSIGYTTGVHIAIQAMQYLPDYNLHISGNMYYDMKEDYMQSLIAKLPPGKIIYHGALTRNAYLSLMQNCQICLSLRDTSSEDHIYNFPSKIGEYMYYNKTVISSLSYPGFENRLIITGWDPEKLAETVLKAGITGINNRKWLNENFGLDAMRKKLIHLYNNGRNG